MEDKINEVNELIDELAEEAGATGDPSIFENILGLKSTLIHLKNDDYLDDEDKEEVLGGFHKRVTEALNEVREFNELTKGMNDDEL